jgi:quinol monooxygenase YgiN
MLLVVGTIRLPPEKLGEALRVMRRMIEASRAEPDCIEYSYAEDVLEAGLIRVTEIWRSPDGLEQHFASPHLAEWRAAWAGLGLTDRNLLCYEVGDPVPV